VYIWNRQFNRYMKKTFMVIN